MRQATGPFRFEATAYYTKFDGFIFRNLTGLMCGETSCGIPGEEELNQALYAQRDATFRGGEFQFQWDVLPVWAGFVGIEGQYDIVRATFSDGTNVPRITPQRLGGGVYYRDGEWLARVNLLHAFAQNDIAVTGETPTGGYNLLRAEISRTQSFKNRPDRHPADHLRRGRQQSPERGHPQPRVFHQGFRADAGRRRAGLCQREILTHSPAPNGRIGRPPCERFVMRLCLPLRVSRSTRRLRSTFRPANPASGR